MSGGSSLIPHRTRCERSCDPGPSRTRSRSSISGLSRDDSAWKLEQNGKEPFQADRVIVATGGLSVPNTGSDGLGFAMLAGLGHTVHPTYPALTPVVADPAPFGHLAS